MRFWGETEAVYDVDGNLTRDDRYGPLGRMTAVIGDDGFALTSYIYDGFRVREIIEDRFRFVKRYTAIIGGIPG